MTLKEIQSLPKNGFKVVSTFSGGGGSCTGYKMAGFDVVWANEFIPAAQETYRANHPETFLNTQDIRTVTGEQLLSEAKMRKGEIDLFDGSPPCASFSMAGKREKLWGEVKKYSDTSQRVDDLFFEYIRLIQETQPKTFVAENVTGLVSGKAKGFFKEIMRSLRECGYLVKAKKLNAMWLGVPQMRERVIIIGVRKDLGMEPVFPKPLSYYYTLKDALEGIHSTEEEKAVLNILPYQIGRLYYEIQRGDHHDQRFTLYRCAWNKPAPTLLQSAGRIPTSGIVHPDEPRKFTIEELKAICSFPPDYQLTQNYSRQVERLGRAVPPVMMKAIAETIRDEILCKLR